MKTVEFYGIASKINYYLYLVFRFIFENLINSPTNAGMQHTYKEKKVSKSIIKKLLLLVQYFPPFQVQSSLPKIYRKLLCIFSGSK